MNFKAQVERDLTAVFHNAREHADVMEFWIDGVRYKGPVIIDDGGAQDRKKPSTDHVDGLVLVDLVVYVPLSMLKTIPQKGLNMEIGDHIYQITKVHPEAGEIVLYAGPSLPHGRLKEHAVFNGTFEDVKAYLADVLEDYPQAERLIVPVERLSAFAAKVKTPGNIAHKYYNDIVSTMRGNKEV